MNYPFQLNPLPFAYDAFEPYIDAKTMELHHDRHLKTYIDNLNNALESHPELHSCTLEQLLFNTNIAIHNNAGGVYNHELYFATLSTGLNPIKEEIIKEFGSFESFKDNFTKAALSVFGSGYAYIVHDSGHLKIITTANQDTPIENGMQPLLNIDVWEHAYYLKNYNLRSNYINNWFNAINK